MSHGEIGLNIQYVHFVIAPHATEMFCPPGFSKTMLLLLAPSGLLQFVLAVNKLAQNIALPSSVALTQSLYEKVWL